MHLCQQYKLGIVMEEKDCSAFLFLRSVQINSLHHVSNFPWVVYLLPDNMRLLNTCAQQALLICLCIVALCCKHSIYTCALLKMMPLSGYKYFPFGIISFCYRDER